LETETSPSYIGLKKVIDELAARIDAPVSMLPDYETSSDFAHPHIEIGYLGIMSFVIVERGLELERKSTRDLDELLYWVFSGITFEMAIKYELSVRKDNMDFRRIVFAWQETLLGILSQDWRLKEAEEHRLILQKYPFNDNSLGS